MDRQLKYIDIFAGCGGLSVGLFNAGWSGLFAIEKNHDAFETLKYNLIDNKKHFSWCDWLSIENHDINEIIETYGSELEKLKGKVQLVAGGPPCQGFSMAGKRNKDDVRNKLVDSYINFIKIIMPEALIFENVKGFTVCFNNDSGKKQYSSYVEVKLAELGYKVAHKIIDMSDYGIPQKRRRFILVAMRTHDPRDVFSYLEDGKEEFCSSKKIKCINTVFDAISDLKQSSGVIQSPDSKNFSAGIYGSSASAYQKLMRAGIRKSKTAVDSHRFVNHTDFTVQLHKELIEKAPHGKRLHSGIPDIPAINRRGVTVLDSSSQSPTVTSIPDELIHYSEPRILTVRECARLQSFPDWYQFKGKYTSGGKRRIKEVPRYTQVGNAVPPLFAEQIGIALKKVLEK